MYISDIPPAVEEVYSHKPPNTSRWYINRLDMVHIVYIMLNFDEVYISDIPPAVSIATWYIYLCTTPSDRDGDGPGDMIDLTS